MRTTRNRLISQAARLHRRLTLKTNAFIDSSSGICSDMPRPYYLRLQRIEDVRANSFNRLCRRQGKSHYRYFKKSQVLTDGLCRHPAQPSVAVGQGGSQ